MGRNRGVGTFEALSAIHAAGGGGVAGLGAFWRGTGPKMVESASKGAILVYAKESLNTSFNAMGLSPGLAGALAGAGGGACQTTIMGPCTFLVTGAVTGNQAEGTLARVSRTWQQHGLKVWLSSFIANTSHRCVCARTSRSPLCGTADCI